MAKDDGGAAICASNDCDSEPTHRVFWPGSSPPPEMCLPCVFRATGISEAMGFTLHTEPLPERTKEQA